MDKPLIGNGKTYVAKRFFNIGAGENNVSPDENEANLELEVERAKIGGLMLKEFYAHAELTGTEVTEGESFQRLLCLPCQLTRA